MVSNRHYNRSNERLNNTKQHLKYPFQRVEQRHNTIIDPKGQKERTAMEQSSQTRLSIGTFNILPPSPKTEVSSFTLAINKFLTEREFLQKLYEIFGTNFDEKQTKSIFVHLVKPIPLQELRKKLNEAFKDNTT